MQSNLGINVSNEMADAVALAAHSVVTVDARKRMPLSGLLIEPGFVLTVHHGVERDESIRVVLPDGSLVEAQLVGRDPGTDLALLKLTADNTAALPVAAQPARVGNLVLAVGRPSGGSVQASLGLVNALSAEIQTHRGAILKDVIFADANPYPGFSGGPLIDLQGGVLGINTSGLVHGMLLAIPLTVALGVASQLKQHGVVKRGYLGIRSQPVEIPEQARSALHREQNTGLLVMGVEANGPAAGILMVGDLIVGFEDQIINRHEDLQAALMGTVVDTIITLHLLRGGSLQHLSLKVGSRV